jgi:hypothetical protein
VATSKVATSKVATSKVATSKAATSKVVVRREARENREAKNPVIPKEIPETTPRVIPTGRAAENRRGRVSLAIRVHRRLAAVTTPRPDKPKRHNPAAGQIKARDR